MNIVKHTARKRYLQTAPFPTGPNKFTQGSIENREAAKSSVKDIARRLEMGERPVYRHPVTTKIPGLVAAAEA